MCRCGEDTLGVAFREAVDRENAGWLRKNWREWEDHGDLLDDVIRKGADVIVWFIQNVRNIQKGVHLLHFLIKEKG